MENLIRTPEQQNQEIERKFILHHDIAEALVEGIKPEIIQQHHLGNPHEDADLRVRKTGSTFTATLKTGELPVRTEVTVPIDRPIYDFYSRRSYGSVYKGRYRISPGLSVDKFAEPMQFWMAEQEYGSRIECDTHVPEFPFLAEVTKDPIYQNRLIADIGSPKEVQLDVGESLDTLQKIINNEIDIIDRPYVIAVNGQTASGKSTLAKWLARRFEVATLHLDDYNRGKTALAGDEEFAETRNWDLLQVYDIDLLRDNLLMLAEGKSTTVPTFDFPSCEPNGYREMQPTPVILIEGIYAHDPRIAELTDLRVGVQAGLPTRMGRRVERDLSRTNWSAQKILGYCLTQAEPTYAKVTKDFENPDITIDTTFA